MSGGPGRTVAYVPDLMDRSKVAAAAAGPVTFVASPAELVALARGEVTAAGGEDTAAGGEVTAAGGEVTLVVVDLSRPGVLDVLPSIGPPTIGFGRHDDRELLAAASKAGCDRVLARNAFFAQAAQLLRGSRE